MRTNRTRKLKRSVLAVLVLALFAAACGGSPGDASVDAPDAADDAAASTEQVAADSNFDWRQQEGAEIAVGFSAHPLAEALIEFIGEFEDLTGISVSHDQAPESDYRVRLNTELAAGSGTTDVFMTGPSTNWEYSAAGWIEDLQPYVDDPSLTAEEWDFDDFFPAAVDVNRWTGEEFAGVGEGPLYAIPVNEEGYALHYRKDVLADAGIDPPDTIDELIAAAEELDGYEFEGQTLDGFVARGFEFWPILITGYGAFLFAHGATDINPDGTSAVAEQPVIDATAQWAELMQYTPDGIASYDWPEAQNHFAAGNAAFFLDADHMAETFEDPEKSAIAGDVGYALPPEGPAGRASGIWLWSLGMNAASQEKEAAWLFMQWASSADVMERTLPYGNINPTRRSVAESDTMAELVADWDDYGTVWVEILDEYAEWRWNPSTNFSEAGDRWARAVQDVYLDGQDPREALEAAEGDINAILERSRSGS